MIQLTKNFDLDEFTESQTAARKGIDQTPSAAVLKNLRVLAEGLEMVRDVLDNKPIKITSGYRSPTLNKAIGSAPTSDHPLGYAADFKCPAFGTPREIVLAIKDSGIKFGQLILEFDSWVHISFNPKFNKQVLIIDRKGTRPFA